MENLLSVNISTLLSFFKIAYIKNQQSIAAIIEGNERHMRSNEDAASREFFAESGDVNINATFTGLASTKLVRSKHVMQDKYDQFRKRFDPLISMARTIIDSSNVGKQTEPEKKVFTMLYERLIRIENEVAEKFAIENSDNVVGAYVLYRYCRVEDYKKLDSLYNLFSDALQATPYLKNIRG